MPFEVQTFVSLITFKVCRFDGNRKPRHTPVTVVNGDVGARRHSLRTKIQIKIKNCLFWFYIFNLIFLFHCFNVRGFFETVASERRERERERSNPGLFSSILWASLGFPPLLCKHRYFTIRRNSPFFFIRDSCVLFNSAKFSFFFCFFCFWCLIESLRLSLLQKTSICVMLNWIYGVFWFRWKPGSVQFFVRFFFLKVLIW